MFIKSSYGFDDWSPRTGQFILGERLAFGNAPMYQRLADSSPDVYAPAYQESLQGEVNELQQMLHRRAKLRKAYIQGLAGQEVNLNDPKFLEILKGIPHDDLSDHYITEWDLPKGLRSPYRSQKRANIMKDNLGIDLAYSMGECASTKSATDFDSPYMRYSNPPLRYDPTNTPTGLPPGADMAAGLGAAASGSTMPSGSPRPPRMPTADETMPVQRPQQQNRIPPQSNRPGAGPPQRMNMPAPARGMGQAQRQPLPAPVRPQPVRPQAVPQPRPQMAPAAPRPMPAPRPAPAPRFVAPTQWTQQAAQNRMNLRRPIR